MSNLSKILRAFYLKVNIREYFRQMFAFAFANVKNPTFVTLLFRIIYWNKASPAYTCFWMMHGVLMMEMFHARIAVPHLKRLSIRTITESVGIDKECVQQILHYNFNQREIYLCCFQFSRFKNKKLDILTLWMPFENDSISFNNLRLMSHPKVKSPLKGAWFESNETVNKKTTCVLKELIEDLEHCFEQWIGDSSGNVMKLIIKKYVKIKIKYFTIQFHYLMATFWTSHCWVHII